MTESHTPHRIAGHLPVALVNPAFAALFAFLAGCGSRSEPHANATRVAPAAAEVRPAAPTLVEGINLSGSSLPLLKASVAFGVELAMAAPDGSRIVVDRFDRSDENVYDGDRPEQEEEFLELVAPRLRPAPGRDLTFTNLFVVRAESCAASAPGPVVVSMAGDGFSEGVGKAGHDAMRAAAARMARNANLRAFFVVGASPAARASLRQDLAPLGERLRFKELSDDPGALVQPLSEGAGR